jgi:hypothetical protein
LVLRSAARARNNFDGELHQSFETVTGSFSYAFPAHSQTVLRIKAR